MNPRRILCPIDFSPSSISAVEYSFKYAEATGAAIHLIHVVLQSKSDVHSGFMAEAQFRLKHMAHELQQSFGKNVGLTYAVVEESEEPSRAINRVAEEEKYDLIAMGTNGVADVEESFFGSNSARVIRQGKVPVMVIPMQVQFTPFNKLVYASEFEEDDAANILRLRKWVGKEAVIHVVHVTDHASLIKKASFSIFKDQLFKATGDEKLEFHLIESTEEVDKALDTYVSKNAAQMLILLAKHRNFLERIFQRSLSKQMVYFTDYPVLVFKE
jgi:nucleotide-binding universal stress UspA family protein